MASKEANEKKLKVESQKEFGNRANGATQLHGSTKVYGSNLH